MMQSIQVRQNNYSTLSSNLSTSLSKHEFNEIKTMLAEITCLDHVMIHEKINKLKAEPDAIKMTQSFFSFFKNRSALYQSTLFNF